MSRVSVIITTHNRPGLLPRAVESARRTSAKGVEIVVVDDASVDETAEVCRGLEGIRYVRAERNQRVAGARNLGILASTGDYLTFLDDDDQRLPGSLDLQLEALSRAPEAAFVYGRVLVSDQHNLTCDESYPDELPRGDIFWALLERNFVPCGSVVFRRSCLYSVGLLDEAIPGVDDWDMWIRLAEIYEVAAVEQAVAIWRRPTPVSGQGSSKTIDLIGESARLLRRRWLALPRARAAENSLRRKMAWLNFSKNVSEHLVWEATSALFGGRIREALQSSRVALGLHKAALVQVAQRWARPSTLRVTLENKRAARGAKDVKDRFKELRLDQSKR